MHDLALLRCIAHSSAQAVRLVAGGERSTASTQRPDSDTDIDTDTAKNKVVQGQESRLEESLNELQACLRIHLSECSKNGRQDDTSTIGELATSCSALCGRILAAVQTARGPKRIGKSFDTLNSTRTVLSHSRQALELRKLSERMQDLQTNLASQVRKVLSIYILDSKHQLRQIQVESRRWQCPKSARQKTLSSALRSLETRLRSLQLESPSRVLSPQDIEAFQIHINQMRDQQRCIKRNHVILKSLAFKSHVSRHDTIPEAHQRTFSWVFSTPESQGPSSDLSLKAWLERDSGVFWVSGKPGAGKSTLMKFIADHERTHAALSKWSSPKRTVIVSHYFWCAGTHMQRSHNGLLQTLLFEILRQLPDAIETLLPERWSSPTLANWTMPDLYQALHQIIGRRNLPVKFCFFIDGLDEFEGDHLALCHELKTLAKSENVKLCLSSRPWTVFEQVFGDGKSGHLRLHDVTKNDIANFVLDRFAQYPEIAKNWTPDDFQSIALKISERSQGVFLWVSLATKHLIESLSEGDSSSSALDRLHQYPTDLDDFFSYSLEANPASDQTKMATSLLITEAAENPLDVGIYYFHEMESADPDYFLALSPEPPSRLEHRRQLSRTKQQLETICRGLLKVDQRTGVVNCLHRTVRDYLDQRQTKTMLRSKAPQGFSPSLCLLKACAAWTKSSRAALSEEPKSEFLSSITSLLAASAQIQSREEVALCRRILDDLDACLVAKGPAAEESLQILRTQVVRHRLWQYLSDIQTRQPRYFDMPEVPALVLALFPDYEIGEVRERRRPTGWDEATRKTLLCLFHQGQDPNQPFSTAETLGAKTEKTPWVVLCEHVLPQHDDKHTGNMRKFQARLKSSLENGILEAFLSSGANANARCQRPGKAASVAATDYLLHAFRLCVEGDQVLKELYLEHIHWFIPKEQDHSNAVVQDFFRIMEKTCGKDGSKFLQQVSEKLLQGSTQRRRENIQ
ncbi:hypothetical protein V2A60_007685 [Cordyceps javanica]